MKKFKVSEDVVIEALGPNEVEHPLIYLRFEDHPEPQVIPIFSVEIRDLIAALTEAACWIASEVGGEP